MTTRMNCERVETLLGERLDGVLDPDVRIEMDAHVASCAECRALLSDFERIVADARVLAPLVPQRDLWSGISSRLGEQDAQGTPEVRSLAEHRSAREVRAPSWKTFTAAAVLLVAISSGVTWQLARGVNGSPAASVAPVTQEAAADANVPSSPVRPQPGPTVASVAARSGSAPAGTDAEDDRITALEAQYTATSEAEVNEIYEREIAALRTIVAERFMELDSATVATLKKNLDIIDKAIVDSREALQRDPRSTLMSRQLDRALVHKLQLMRKVALL